MLVRKWIIDVSVEDIRVNEMRMVLIWMLMFMLLELEF